MSVGSITMPRANVGSLGESAWSPLYRLGAFSAIAMLVLIPVQVAVFILWPLPNTVEAWFSRFNENAVVGLLNMDLLLIVDWALTVLVFLALVALARAVHPAWLVIATTFELLAAAAYFTSTGAFEMLALSSRYAVSASDTERIVLLAAGETVLGAWQGTGFVIAAVLSAIALLILSGVLLRSGVLGRAIPLLGIAMGVTAIVPPNAGTVGLVFSLAYLLPFVAWLVLVARALFREPVAISDPGDAR